MFRNHIKIAFRNLLKNKLFSFINIVGLGLAIPFALLSLMQVQSAYEYDNFHPKADRIYRVLTAVKSSTDKITEYGSSPAKVEDELNTNYPFVEKATHTKREFGWELNDGVKSIEVNTLFVEPSFFDMFEFPLKEGSIPDAPNTIVLTEEMAKIFFANSDPIGRVLTHPDYGEFTVTGVLKQYKKTTHFRSDVMVSMATFNGINSRTNAMALNGYTYVLVDEKANEKSLVAALSNISKKVNEFRENSKEEFSFQSQALSKISPDLQNLEDNPYVESLSDLSVNLGLALAILLLAAFNYTNLTLARSISRAKEVGIRKVAGAGRKQLVVQFIFEAVVMASLALGFGFVVLKIMQQFIHVNWITWQVDNQLVLWLMFSTFTILIGVLAGVVPAWILSGFKPVNVLKGTISPATFGKIGFRKSLVVTQLVVTACFIFLIANMYSQFNYMATDNSNFNRKNIYNLSINSDYQALKNEISANKNVERIGLSSRPFGGSSETYTARKEKLQENIPISYYAADANFISNMNLDIIAGENLPKFTGDSASTLVILNENALFSLGMGTPEEAVGNTILLNDTEQVIVCGVVKDFCYSNYQFAAQPLVLQYNPEEFHQLSIKTKADIDQKAFKSEIEIYWKKEFPNDEMGFSNFQSELFERYYPGADMRFLGMVCVIIFVIAILGLLGIVTYTTQKRFKEVVIRKIIGASVLNIIKELSISFLKLILISTLICMPLGYFIAFVFINMFAFNDGVDYNLMVALYAVVFLIALLAIIIMAIKTALANPVKGLRRE